jgi:hypothetical protein
VAGCRFRRGPPGGEAGSSATTGSGAGLCRTQDSAEPQDGTPDNDRRRCAREQRRCREERSLSAPAWADLDLVFTNRPGGPIEPGNVNANLSRLLADAGLPRIRVHDLPHTTATALLEAGAHPKVVQDLLGHSAIAVTLDTYSHVAPALHQQGCRATTRAAGQGRLRSVRERNDRAGYRGQGPTLLIMGTSGQRRAWPTLSLVQIAASAFRVAKLKRAPYFLKR